MTKVNPDAEIAKLRAACLPKAGTGHHLALKQMLEIAEALFDESKSDFEIEVMMCTAASGVERARKMFDQVVSVVKACNLSSDAYSDPEYWNQRIASERNRLAARSVPHDLG